MASPAGVIRARQRAGIAEASAGSCRANAILSFFAQAYWNVGLHIDCALYFSIQRDSFGLSGVGRTVRSDGRSPWAGGPSSAALRLGFAVIEPDGRGSPRIDFPPLIC